MCPLGYCRRFSSKMSAADESHGPGAQLQRRLLDAAATGELNTIETLLKGERLYSLHVYIYIYIYIYTYTYVCILIKAMISQISVAQRYLGVLLINKLQRFQRIPGLSPWRPLLFCGVITATHCIKPQWIRHRPGPASVYLQLIVYPKLYTAS